MNGTVFITPEHFFSTNTPLNLNEYQAIIRTLLACDALKSEDIAFVLSSFPVLDNNMIYHFTVALCGGDNLCAHHMIKKMVANTDPTFSDSNDVIFKQYHHQSDDMSYGLLDNIRVTHNNMFSFHGVIIAIIICKDIEIT